MRPATAELSAQHYELIQEEFGDGIMSAIDFDMTMERLPDPKGDRVKAQPVEIPPHPNLFPQAGRGSAPRSKHSFRCPDATPPCAVAAGG
jgi:hypothetical protein